MNRFYFLVLSALLTVVVGCEEFDDDVSLGRNHQPPAGMGAIVIENDSFADWNVVIDGVHLGRVATSFFLVHNVAPGEHLVHMDEHNGSDTKTLTVEVTDGSLTVVRIKGNSTGYDVGTFTIEASNPGQ